MQYIFIVATPPGEAPLWIKQEWIGLTLPIREVPPEEKGFQVGVLGGQPENIDGYHVKVGEALRILEAKSPEAARWWRSHPVIKLFEEFVFKREVCRLLNDN